MIDARLIVARCAPENDVTLSQRRRVTCNPIARWNKLAAAYANSRADSVETNDFVTGLRASRQRRLFTFFCGASRNSSVAAAWVSRLNVREKETGWLVQVESRRRARRK